MISTTVQRITDSKREICHCSSGHFALINLLLESGRIDLIFGAEDSQTMLKIADHLQRAVAEMEAAGLVKFAASKNQLEAVK